MKDVLITRAGRGTVPLTPLAPPALDEWMAAQPRAAARWAERTAPGAAPGGIKLIPGEDGELARAVVLVDPASPIASFGDLARQLPDGTYRIDADLDAEAATAAALGWALGAYAFERYRRANGKPARLVWPRGADRAHVEAAAAATALVRDLINTPAGDMGPPELAAAARRLARRHKARLSVTVGDDLLRRNYPAIHAVGRAAAKAPRLIDLRWGRADAPRLTLVGKGVCFDTGGLDIKPAGGMRLMKKDMGGAAHVLGLAHMIMAANLGVRLRVLIPAVENSISGNALYPLDVVTSRSGRTIEIGHTDAEGRVILADALTEAASEAPDLLIDFATLTGAARVALGTEVAALFANDDALAADIVAAGERVEDAAWRLPLWQPYADHNRSKVADISNEPSSGHGGAISAALFLESFVGRSIRWAHLDIMGWNVRARPGRPEGGEAMGMRAVFEVIRERYGRIRRSGRR